MTQQTQIVVLGSTGSVGTQALDVVRAMPGRFRVVGLAGNSNWRDLARQAEEFQPEAVCVAGAEAAEKLRSELPADVQLLEGEQGLVELASWPEAHTVVSAVAGGAGLPAALAALRAGKRLALANKEPVVMCGHLLQKAAEQGGGTLLPVDSEHSAVFQLLLGVAPEEVSRVILTASGGPFRGCSPEELRAVTPEQALDHPTWNMGPKITIDSATLMNKALEIIEACRLFHLPADRVDVVVHPQSIVHAVLELTDGSMLAHMGRPDMRLPIQYALTYPERTAPPTDGIALAELGRLEFEEPDLEAFPALELGFRVARLAGTTGAVLSAANEVAVDAFLNETIQFTDIIPTVQRVLDRHENIQRPDLATVLDADAWAREEAKECLT
jgi:1-deoxy-D-xylulose-5-phosphate reductoisomerase